MSGRPDFDVGDLVVCVDDAPCRVTGELFPIRLGQVVQVDDVYFEPFCPVLDGCWVVQLNFLPARINATRFRKLDPRPPEFFSGKIEAGVRQDQPEQVPA